MSTRPSRSISATSRVLIRWRGMGALLAVAFYSLFFAAHHRFHNTPVYMTDGVLFGSRTQTVFNDLIALREGDHRSIGAEHPAFTLLHQPAAQLIIKGLQFLGLDVNSARKHGVAVLTCLAGALGVVMVYHALLWGGVGALRCILLAAIYGAGTCAWIVVPLPETWTFAGLGLAAVAAVAARGPLARWWLHLLAAVYAMSCFVGNVIPVLLLALVRCAQDTAAAQKLSARPLVTALAAAAITFGLANLQRVVFPRSAALPTQLLEWREADAGWTATAETPARVAREVFISNIVAPKAITTKTQGAARGRARVVLDEDASWSGFDLQTGVGTAWLLLLVLGGAGLVWRAVDDPFTLGIAAVLVWSIAALPWYGSPDRLLLLACLWTPMVVLAVGLGLERTLVRWPRLAVPVTLLLAAFLAAQITRNWIFLQDVARMVRL